MKADAQVGKQATLVANDCLVLNQQAGCNRVVRHRTALVPAVDTAHASITRTQVAVSAPWQQPSVACVRTTHSMVSVIAVNNWLISAITRRKPSS